MIAKSTVSAVPYEPWSVHALTGLEVHPGLHLRLFSVTRIPLDTAIRPALRIPRSDSAMRAVSAVPYEPWLAHVLTDLEAHPGLLSRLYFRNSRVQREPSSHDTIGMRPSKWAIDATVDRRSCDKIPRFEAI